jgi:2-amino-4-hydroxy-6-hydroxymethyldihydropteridine diphosphokinase
MTKPNIVFVLLGGNIEPRLEYLQNAKNELEKHLGKLVNESSIFETEAWGFETKSKFLNMVLQFETEVDAVICLKTALEIELKLGRLRNADGTYSSRTIDIDLLYFNSEIIESKELIIPHPRIHLRRFTLIPLVEIAPEFVHPIKGITNKQMLSLCDDKTEVLEFGRLN